jgi:phage terminase small subunit
MTANRRARCPNGLIEEAQNLWGEIVTKYELGEHELSLLRSAVKALTALRKVQAEIERDGATVHDRFRQVHAHPSVKTLQILDSQFRANLADLGLADADAELEKAQEKPATFNKNGGFLRKVH